MPKLASLDKTPASRFCFGTMQFGGGSSELESAACFNACRELGINFFDCAWAYAGGKSEERLGRLIAKERAQLIITSKGGHGAAPGAPTCKANLTIAYAA